MLCRPKCHRHLKGLVACVCVFVFVFVCMCVDYMRIIYVLYSFTQNEIGRGRDIVACNTINKNLMNQRRNKQYCNCTVELKHPVAERAALFGSSIQTGLFSSQISMVFLKRMHIIKK